jgi:hypothetical protein
MEKKYKINKFCKVNKVIAYTTLWKWMTKNSVFLMTSWKRQVQVPNDAYEIKITIPEGIGNIYTMADRDQGKRRKQHQRGCDIQY